MPTNKINRKRLQHEDIAIHSHKDKQSGDECVKKTVLHGNRADYVRDGKLHRIHDKRVTQESSDPNSEKPSASDGVPESYSVKDPNFEAELQYDGYKDIAEYDNDEYEADVDGKGNLNEEVKLEDRPERESAEENSLDPQENNAHHTK